MSYDPRHKEEEIKNRVAPDVFGDYDCARILGAVDFCVMPRAQAVPGNLNAERSDHATRGSIHGDKGYFIGKTQSRRERGDDIKTSASSAPPRLCVEKNSPAPTPVNHWIPFPESEVDAKPNGHMNPDSPDAEYTRLIGDLRAAMKALAAQIAPKVREHGFLR